MTSASQRHSWSKLGDGSWVPQIVKAAQHDSQRGPQRCRGSPTGTPGRAGDRGDGQELQVPGDRKTADQRTVNGGVWRRPHGLDLLDVFWGPRGHCQPRWNDQCQRWFTVCSILCPWAHLPPLTPGRGQANPVPAQASCAPLVTPHLTRFSIAMVACQGDWP